MLQNLSHYRYFSHYSIIKFEGFEPIYYTINAGAISYSMVFNDLVFVFVGDIFCHNLRQKKSHVFQQQILMPQLLTLLTIFGQHEF